MSKCPWHRYLRVDDKGKYYVTDEHGIEKDYGDKEALIQAWSKKHIPNCGITYTIIDETIKAPPKKTK